MTFCAWFCDAGQRALCTILLTVAICSALYYVTGHVSDGPSVVNGVLSVVKASPWYQQSMQVPEQAVRCRLERKWALYSWPGLLSCPNFVWGAAIWPRTSFARRYYAVDW